ncbi:alpha-ketoacid dehydrogenase subunit beta [Phytohabitans aurantiacus]|uniref:TPP-dependent acetoin dehydrogenase complex, E1 protein subunit beta n=1 Tax=Phytohabitans aurantiacus TaxID=3016789 RepID=A0ABQ5RBU3_9ACTN|nr:transketolase C-terminal domain-containing protein [Phytohabitans aurantiacus]GLI03868.1 TPP-dependent acetoin dehydrogenase complex, E1 protein subunit beta [Phytohabitans aurantiacus]
MTEHLAIWRALNAALRDALAADDRVFVMGEDLTKWATGGGIYGVTKRLADEFGTHRIRDTPISEEAIVAAGVGAAIQGCRPVVEIMYSDFSLLAMDPIVNQAAKTRYMFNGQFQVPLVIRSNGGSGIGKAAQHSQSLETLFAHIPGLEVVLPATPDDAYGLLRTAIQSPNPTIFLEHKALYNVRGPVRREPVPFGKARVACEGSDLTIVATQLMLHRALAVAARAAETGVYLEVIDPRTLYPLDLDTIARSVAKTRRLLIAHEAPRDFGFGAEIAASLTEQCWDHLDAAPVRVAGARTPIPYAEELEREVIPDEDDLVRAIAQLVPTSAGIRTSQS